MSGSHLLASPAVLASIGHAPVIVAVPIVAAVVLLKLVAGRRWGVPALGGGVVVRCAKGHTFATRWSSLGSLTSVRLGFARFQYCPVGKHWSLVKPVEDSDLSGEDRRMTEQSRR